MANKRLVLKEGWLVEGVFVKSCHFATVLHKERFYEQAEDYLVLINGEYSFRREYHKEVFRSKSDAEIQAQENDKKNIKIWQEQLEYYKGKLGV